MHDDPVFVSRSRLRRFRILLCSVAIVAVFLVGELWLFRDYERLNHLWVNSFWTFTALAAAIRCHLTARRAVSSRLKKAWYWFTAACAFWFLGMLWWSWRELVMHVYTPFPEISEIGFFAYSPCAIFGIYNYRRITTRGFTSRWIHIGEIGYLVCLSLFTYVVLLYDPILRYQGSRLYFVSALAYPALRGATFLYAFVALEVFNWGKRRSVLMLLILSQIAIAVTDVIYAASLLQRSYRVGHALDVFWVVSFLILFWAAAEEDRLRYRLGLHQEPIPQVRFLGTLLPAALLAFVMLALYSFHLRTVGKLDSFLIIDMVLLSLFQGFYSWGYRDRDAKLSEALEIEKSNLDAVLEQVPVGCVIANRPNGEIVRINRRARAILGLESVRVSRVEELGRLFRSYYPDGRPYPWHEWPLVRSLIARQSVEGEELHVVRKDGNRMILLVNSAPVVQDGHIPSGVVAFLDISEIRRSEAALRESEARKDAIFRSAIDGIITMDTAGKIQDMNPAAERTFGYKASETIGRDLASLIIPPELRAAHYRGLARYLESGETKILGKVAEFNAMRSDGSRFPAEVSICQLTMGGRQFFTGFVRDISDRKAAEESRERLFNHERRARADAEALVELRDRFVMIVSHEFMTPLTPVKLNLEVLERRLKQIPQENVPQRERLLESLSRAQSQVARVIELSTALLEFSRIQLGRLDLYKTETDLSETARYVLSRLSNSLKTAHCPVHTHFEEGLVGLWDRPRIEEVISSLVSNAMKFGSEKPIEVEVKKTDGFAQLSISDRGPGIAAEDRDKVFERFERLAPITQFGGLGLGLYIAREIVLAHGGSARIESHAGGGARVVILLPLSQAQARPAA